MSENIQVDTDGDGNESVLFSLTGHADLLGPTLALINDFTFYEAERVDEQTIAVIVHHDSEDEIEATKEMLGRIDQLIGRTSPWQKV